MTPTPTDTMEGRPTGREGELHKLPPAGPGIRPPTGAIATFNDPRLPARFWAKVRQNSETGCWEWTAANRRGGYGQFSFKGGSSIAHKVSYENLRKPVPDKLVLDHLCRVRLCVNPTHLEPVTIQENLRRGLPGGAGWNAKITHCKHGHEYTPENTYLSARTGYRNCLKCREAHRLARSIQKTDALVSKLEKRNAEALGALRILWPNK